MSTKDRTNGQPRNGAGGNAAEPLRGGRSLAGELIERLRAQIERGEPAPGGKLPTEQAMIARFEVSRTVVREAIAALRAECLVETRQGAGAFVTRDLQRRPFRIDPDAVQGIRDILRVMELRMCVEVEAAGLAATRRTPAQLLEVQGTLTDLRTAIEAGEDGVGADCAFHFAVSKATDNPFFVSFLRFLGSHIIPRRNDHGRRFEPRDQRRHLERTCREHEVIAAALVRQDAAAARRAMRAHIQRGCERYRKLLDDGGDGD